MEVLFPPLRAPHPQNPRRELNLTCLRAPPIELFYHSCSSLVDIARIWLTSTAWVRFLDIFNLVLGSLPFMRVNQTHRPNRWPGSLCQQLTLLILFFCQINLSSLLREFNLQLSRSLTNSNETWSERDIKKYVFLLIEHNMAIQIITKFNNNQNCVQITWVLSTSYRVQTTKKSLMLLNSNINWYYLGVIYPLFIHK